MRYTLFWLAALCSTALAQPDVARVKAVVEAESRKAGTQAVEFGMWQNDRELVTLALGNSMTTVPATTAMHFRIGGISETFMTTLALQLAEQNRLNLDEKISRWFPGLLGADQVTVRMLMSCTAGYVDYVWVDEFGKAQRDDPFRTFSDEELIHYGVQGGKLAYPPGTSQHYSHTEYVLLGQVLQRATGQPIKQLYEENILKPMGLTETSYPVDQEMPFPALHAFSSERGPYEDVTCWNPSWASSNGELISTLHDLGRWGPIFGKGQLISPEHFREQTGPGTVGKGKNTPNRYFAYGFVVINGWFVQNPAFNGYSGAFAYNPSNGVTLVVAATKARKPAIDPAAIYILKRVIAAVTPGSPLDF